MFSGRENAFIGHTIFENLVLLLLFNISIKTLPLGKGSFTVLDIHKQRKYTYIFLIVLEVKKEYSGVGPNSMPTQALRFADRGYNRTGHLVFTG